MKYIGTKKIETERLILRKIEKDDYKMAYYNWCNSSIVCKYTMWDKHKNIDVTKELFDEWIQDYKDLDTYKWIVEIKDTKELIGTIDVVSKKLMSYGACEIGYCYGEKYWRHGYATEALKGVIKFLFEECDAEVVYAEYMSNNIGSGKVIAKAGMKFEGFLRNRIVDKDGIRNDLGAYSITKEENFQK